MSEIWPIGLLGAAVASWVSSLVVPLAGRAGRRWGRTVGSGPGRQHPVSVPRTGGIAILGGVLAGAVGALAVFLILPLPLPSPFFFTGGVPGGQWQVGAYAAAVAAIFGIGLLDDIHRLAPGSKLLVQVSASCLVVAAGLSFCHGGDSSGAPMHPPYPIGCSIVTVLWVVGVTNAFNFMDGLDGLLAGVAAIITGCLAGLAVLLGDPLSAAAALILCGGCLGFLWHNWSPARIFLGDSGSLVIGFVVACISVSVASRSSNHVAVIVPLLMLGIPVIDALFVVRERFVEAGSSSFPERVARTMKGDLLHLHFLLVEITKYRNAVWILYGLVAFFCLLALSVAVTNLHALAVGTLIAELVVVALLRGANYARR